MTTKSDEIIGISLGEHRLTALFCERVLPLRDAQTVPEEFLYDRGYEMLKRSGPGFDDLEATLFKALKSGEDPGTVVDRFGNWRAAQLQSFLAKEKLRSIPFFTTAGTFDGFVNQGNLDSVEIGLAQAPIIDVEDLSWDHITELRFDPDFHKKLLNFRLLLYEDYRGKDINYVRDSLLKKVDNYEDACRKHGLKLVLSTINQILSSKSLLGTLGLVTAGILTGNPAVVAASAVAGSAIELGKMSVHIAQKKLEFDEKTTQDGVAYLMEIRKRATVE